MDFQALKHRARSKQTPLIEKSMLGFYSSSHEAAAEPSVLLIPAGQGGETTEKLNTLMLPMASPKPSTTCFQKRPFRLWTGRERVHARPFRGLHLPAPPSPPANPDLIILSPR